MSISPVSSSVSGIAAAKPAHVDAAAAKKLKLAQQKLQTDTAKKADAATLKADRAAIAKDKAQGGKSANGVDTYA